MKQMKQQFKFSPLATAILTLLCGSSIQSSYAANSTEVVSNVNNQELKQQVNESYPGQAFFDQYYVTKDNPEVATRKQNPQFASYCQGTWITPIAQSTPTSAPADAPTNVSADYAHYNPNGDSVLEGNVVVEQPGREVRAQKLILDKTQTHALAQGNVQMAQNGLISQSQNIDYDLQKQTGALNNSYFISEANHAHGYAGSINKSSSSEMILDHASYTTCAPGKSPDWKLNARKINLNQDTGRGVTRDTTFYIKNVPVMYLPYYNFPIDDRRTTGLLTPNFGWSSNGGFRLDAPIYLNLAPNYDATVTPRYLEEHGVMLEGKLRFKTQNFGQGSISGGYLPDDKHYNNQDRKSLKILHNWQVNNYFSTNLEYNYLSDIDYLYDLANDPNVSTDLNQKRLFQVNFANAIPGLDAALKVEQYQTLDKTLAAEERPYARLPQFLLNYKTTNPQGFQFEYHNDSAYFQKTLYNLGSPNTYSSGTRIYNSVATRYNFRTPWAFAIPEVSARSLNYVFSESQVNSKNQNTVVPQFTLDTGLNFQKDGKYLQTITPRVFYAYSPYKNQGNNPNFDTTTSSISYDQLFSPYRFYGHDRLDDNNFASLGISYSLFDQQGLERLKAALGQSFYFSDRRVQLSPTDAIQKDRTSDPILSLSSQLSNQFTISTNLAFDGKNVSQANFQTYYTGYNGRIYNLGYYKRETINNSQQSYDQVVASLIQPVDDNWRIIGHVQYDLSNHLAREYLLGVNYESCCWAVSVYGRSYFNDLDDVTKSNVKRTNAIMAEFTLKGLGAFNNRLSSLLEQRITGFSKSNQTWTRP
ncbi:hypothetical protein P256_00501 [Acinetobacter nectaris CIP 110549]|uniref:LPS-assembly protein LptD n=2 Tax=Acinetobacter nectaris TaxID=1219382 RepID=V2TR55_9GAMM|nr:hypothetical protein P256_00501 [Acinetobacter nectaris CIP 110549]